MTTINRKDFLDQVAGGAINVNDLTSETKDELAKAGISNKDLLEIAGKDGQISGAAEFNKLFKMIDEFDHDGSFNSIDVSQTESGAIYDAMKSEIERNRAKAHTQGVIHLGMRDASVKEADALEKGNPKSSGGVVRIEAFRADGVIEYNNSSMDLKTDAGRLSFRNALVSGPDKIPRDQADKLVDFLATQDENTRDELAELGLALFRTGKGELPMSRLVISGHGVPSGYIFGDTPGRFSLDDVERLAKIFPQGAGKIEHVAVSACFCASSSHFETLKRAFPNLKSAYAYNEFSPEAEKGAPADLSKWESMTDGDDPSQVVPSGSGEVATWNVAGGTKGLPKITLKEAEKRVKELNYVLQEYRTGKRKPSQGTHDPELNDYYVRLADLLRHPDISLDRKKEVEAIRVEVFKLRHPELGH